MLSPAEERFISEQLQHFQCSPRETAIYLAVLRCGPSSVQELAKELQANRVTIHSAAAQLLKKGLLYEGRKGKRRLLVAEQPDSLSRLLSVKERELEEAKANLGYVIGLLRKEYSFSSEKPSVQLYEGSEGFRRMLEMSLSAEGEFLGLINVELFSKHLHASYLESYFKRRSERGILSRLIWPDIELDAFAQKILPKQREYKISVRTLPQQSQWRSGFISWNRCISLKSFSAGKISCTIIENDDIVSFYRDVVFETLWQQARPVAS